MKVTRLRDFAARAVPWEVQVVSYLAFAAIRSPHFWVSAWAAHGLLSWWGGYRPR